MFLSALGAFGVFATVLAVFWFGKHLGLDELAVSTGLIVATLILASATIGLFVVSQLDALRQTIEQQKRY